MKIKSLLIIILLTTQNLFAQNVGINATGVNPDNSAMLDIVSTDKGILIPRVSIAVLTTAAPITSPVNSLLVFNTNAATGEGYYYWDNANTTWVKLLDANSNSDEDWHKATTTTSPTSINDDIFTNGNVGIGLNNPTAPLDFGALKLNKGNGTVATASDIFMTSDGLIATQSNMFLNIDSDGNGSGNLYISEGTETSAATKLVTILNNGNVGIGTSSPNAPLEISPTNTAAIQEGIRLIDEGGGSNEGLWIQFGQNTTNDYARIGGYSEDNTSGALYFSTKDNADANPIEKMRIEADGDVGIGINNPSSRLYVYKQTGDTKITIEADPTNANEQDNPSIEFLQDGQLIKASIGMYHGPGVGFLGTPIVNRTTNNALVFNTYASSVSTTNSKIDFATIDTVRMTINASGGNVGIGINAPLHQLDVYETNPGFAMRIFNFQDASGNGLLIESNGASNDDTLFHIRGDLNGTPVNLFTVVGDGRVGVNHDNPNALTKLDVNGYMIGKNFLFSAYSSNTVSNFGNGVVAFAEINDPHSDYAGNVYTAPVDGYYFFSTNITLDGGDGTDDTIYLEFLKNGTSVNRLFINPKFSTRAGNEYTQSNSTIINLSAGDQVSVNIADVNAAIVDMRLRSFMGYMISK